MAQILNSCFVDVIASTPTCPNGTSQAPLTLTTCLKDATPSTLISLNGTSRALLICVPCFGVVTPSTPIYRIGTFPMLVSWTSCSLIAQGYHPNPVLAVVWFQLAPCEASRLLLSGLFTTRQIADNKCLATDRANDDISSDGKFRSCPVLYLYPMRVLGHQELDHLDHLDQTRRRTKSNLTLKNPMKREIALAIS